VFSGFKKRNAKADESIGMPDHQNPFVREGLLRRTALFAVALAASYAMVPLFAPGKHPLGDFTLAIALSLLTVLAVIFAPWRRLPTWTQIVPPLMYTIVVALLYREGGGATSGFGTLLMLPILWLALYGSQAQMIMSLIATGVVVAVPQLALGGIENPEVELRRGILIMLVGTVMGFTVQRLVQKVRVRASEETERADTMQEATQQFDRAFETAPIGMAMTTVDGRFTRVNPALCSMLGRAREDLVGRRMEEITHPDERAADRAALPKLLSSEISTYQAEKRYLHVNGRIVWSLLSMTLVRDSAGDPRHLFAQMQDVTGRRLAEERLREAEERYRTMVEQLPLVTYVDALDNDSSAIYMSPQVEPLLGYPVEDWISDREMFPKLLHPDDRERVMKEVERCNDTGASFEEEYRLIARDGHIVWVRDQAQHLRGPDGSLRQMQGLMIDITEQKQSERLLRDAEERYRQLVERLPAISYIAAFGGAGKWLYVSPQIESTIGFTPAEWTAKPSLWSDQLHPDDRERAIAAERHALDSGEPLAIEYRMRGRNGELHWFRDEAIVIEGEDGPGRYLSGMMTDVTEQKLTEQALRDSEKRFRAVGTQAPVGIFENDAAGDCIFANDRWCEIAEMSSEQALGRGWTEALHPNDRERVMSEWKSAAEAGDSFEAQCRFQTPSGAVRWITASAVPMRDESGLVTGFLGTIVDVTERKRNERHRAIQYAISKAMADSTGYEDAIGRVIAALGESMEWGLAAFWQSEVEHVSTASIGRPVPLLRCTHTWADPGLSAEEFLTRCREMTFSSPLGMVGRVWEGGRGEWSGSLGEARSRRAQLAVELGMNSTVCLPVYGGTELIGMIEAFGRDVENPGDVFLDARSGVGRQVGEYIERKRAENEIDIAKDEFFALVSHELRTPLTSIIGYLELMQEDSSMAEDEKQHFLGIVHRNADRLLRLVGDLLLVAQVQAGKFALAPGPLDLNAIAHHAVETAKPIANGRTIGLRLKTEPVPVFDADRDRIAQLFDNLITNALKFTDPGERVEVRISTKGERAIVEVNNSGSVIPESERESLFDRFYRASDATKRVAPGVGLGLAIVKAIVEAHGGTIRVDSSELQGTTFRFSLPLIHEPAGQLPSSRRRAA
jgi:PAS domain S-box-containing protein